VRLFLALWPDEATRAAIAAWQREWVWPAEAALVPAERFHLTLHFIGNLAREKLPRLGSGLKVPFAPFDFELRRGEVWPNSVAVLQPDRAPPEMKRLHDDLAGALRQLELPVDSRPFRPHVTLVRRARGAVPPAEHSGVRWRASQGYVLAQSLPARGGYEVVERFGLR
jgi:2'-5' RNA ligase